VLVASLVQLFGDLPALAGGLNWTDDDYPSPAVLGPYDP